MSHAALESYCSVCDADSNVDCGHTAHRYLDRIVYERSEFGYTVPDSERERWEKGPGWIAPAPKETKPIQRLVVELEAEMFLDEPLERRLRSAYEGAPEKVARLVDSIVAEIRAGKLHSPSGLLVSKLKHIEGSGRVPTPRASTTSPAGDDDRPPGWDSQ